MSSTALGRDVVPEVNSTTRDVVGIGELRGRLGSAGGGEELVGRDHLLARTDDHVAVLGVGDHQRGRQPVDQLPEAVAR